MNEAEKIPTDLVSFFDYRAKLIHDAGMQAVSDLGNRKFLRKMGITAVLEPFRRGTLRWLSVITVFFIYLAIVMSLMIATKDVQPDELRPPLDILFSPTAVAIYFAPILLVVLFKFEALIGRRSEPLHYRGFPGPQEIVNASKVPSVNEQLVFLIQMLAAGQLKAYFDWDGKGLQREILGRDVWANTRAYQLIFYDPSGIQVGRNHEYFFAKKIFFSPKELKKIPFSAELAERKIPPVQQDLIETIESFEPKSPSKHDEVQVLRALISARPVVLRPYLEKCARSGAFGEGVYAQVALGAIYAFCILNSEKKLGDLKRKSLEEARDLEFGKFLSVYDGRKESAFIRAFAEFVDDPAQMDRQYYNQKLKTASKTFLDGKGPAGHLAKHLASLARPKPYVRKTK